MRERVRNPILPGFYPDPSVCRVEDDYYLVTSSFAYFPGVPIFHSKDLVHWEQIGNILNREEQLNLSNAGQSRGIFAPTIRYHEGTFYMITTNVSDGGNFIVTATDPRGPWSNPYFLKGAEGIDPSLFFDDDGRCYYTGTKDRREGAAYYGDNEIWVQEVDLSKMQLVGASYPIWHGALRDVEWPEGPHLYKKDGTYYLLIAEAGTGQNHAVTIAKSDSLMKPFMGCPYNPILTHRHLGRNYPIVNVGHGDLVETQNGDWYMVTLASRPYGGYYRNLGRETFLVPVTWEGEWPIVNYGIGLVEDTVELPNLPVNNVNELPEKEDFDEDKLSYRFIFNRNPIDSNYSLTDRKGYLRMYLSKDSMTDTGRQTAIYVRQTGISYEFESSIFFEPNPMEEVGIILQQSHEYHYRFCLVKENGVKVLKIYKVVEGTQQEIAHMQIENRTVLQEVLLLKATVIEQNIQFSYGYDGISYQIVKSGVDGRILSSDVAGGFVGTCVGVYATSNGQETKSFADIDWIRYKNIN